MSLIFFSEYLGDDRVAQIYKNTATNAFEVFCYTHGELKVKEVLTTESRAEDFAEDWVL